MKSVSRIEYLQEGKKYEIRKRKEERKTARSRRYMIASEERMNVAVEGAGSTSRVG